MLYRVKQMTLSIVTGTEKEQYASLWKYCEELRRSNPETTTKVKCQLTSNREPQFRRIYICLGPLKKEFLEGCRRLIRLDGCWLKTACGGVLLTTVGLINAIQYHVEEAKHKHCLRHLHSNFSREFTGLAFKMMMYAAGKALRIVDWQKHMNDIQRLDANAHLWLSERPAKHWCRSHFICVVKCDILLNNLCETFNKHILVVRGKLIISLLEYIRQYINGRIVKQRAACHKYKGGICHQIQKLLEDNKSNATDYSEVWNGGNEFEVYHANGEKQV
ncbi:hypothetical protein LIER_23245 [Lithospermum erythrorhizon]|uniref:Uncharacterized protein n=1 Tax=Lithospermum erythrorhizon TaxID=34254 RepID=A0AAV3QZC5_LITER